MFPFHSILTLYLSGHVEKEWEPHGSIAWPQASDKVAIGEDFERRCLHNHMLHQMQAMKDHRFDAQLWLMCQLCFPRNVISV